ncbi:MAG: hypothetical protein WAO69_08360 [Aestuariivita sp.]|uniref:hypothetical protein n=1 Tax=Aestuariivita sp. TaxID=1872407 RepID=UPI003BB1C214
MTDHRYAPVPSNPPVHAHPLRDWLALELMLPSQSSLMERIFDRIEAGRSQ